MSIGLLYLLFVVLPNTAATCGPILTISAVGIFVSGMGYVMCSLDEVETGRAAAPFVRPVLRSFLAMFFIFLVLNILTPTEKQIWTVAGGYAATNNAELKKLPDNVLKTANDYLERMQHSIEKDATNDSGKHADKKN